MNPSLVHVARPDLNSWNKSLAHRHFLRYGLEPKSDLPKCDSKFKVLQMTANYIGHVQGDERCKDQKTE